MTVGIICEYNPFHNGHKKQIDFIKNTLGEDTRIVCVMSGNLTQRGECALTDKYSRAEAAVLCGTDAVLELPFPYASASADYFAFAGVNILDRLGADYICFGSECADENVLWQCAKALASPEFQEMAERIEKESSNLGSAAATFKALEEICKKSVPKAPNDILAISYLKHIYLSNSSIKPLIIKREGDYNSSLLSSEQNPSATAIRAAIASGRTDGVSKFMPSEAFSVFKEAIERGECSSNEKFCDVLFTYYRFARAKELSGCAELSGGLENRILKIARESSSAADFFSKLPTKKYTDARIRRAMIFGMTDVRESDLKAPPAYVNLLAANSHGRSLAAQWKKQSALTVLSKPADFSLLGEAAERQASLMLSADSLFTLCKKNVLEAGFYFKKSPKIL